MAIGGKEYSGWILESISFDSALFTVNLVRRSLSRAEIDLDGQFVRARIIVRWKKIIISNAYSGAEIDEIEQSKDGQGNVHCIFRFSSDSFIEFTAGEITDLRF